MYLNMFYVEWVMQVIKKHINKHIFHISIYVAITKQHKIWDKQSKMRIIMIMTSRVSPEA